MATKEDFIKCVVVGDGAVGKTSLLFVFTNNCFPEEYVATVFDNYQTTVEIDNKNVQLGLWDTAGQDDFDRIRPVSYAGAQIFLVCYSVVFPQSYENVRLKWVPEIEHHVGVRTVPMLLIGLKDDLRADQKTLDALRADGKAPITEQQAQQLKKDIGAAQHIVCSAKTQKNVKEVFEAAIRLVLAPKRKKGGCCSQ